MSEWQPIETAPKDGTAIIGWYAQISRPCVTWYTKIRSNRHSGPGWKINIGRTVETLSLHAGPVFWMPLPSPPATATPVVKAALSTAEAIQDNQPYQP